MQVRWDVPVPKGVLRGRGRAKWFRTTSFSFSEKSGVSMTSHRVSVLRGVMLHKEVACIEKLVGRGVVVARR